MRNRNGSIWGTARMPRSQMRGRSSRLDLPLEQDEMRFFELALTTPFLVFRIERTLSEKAQAGMLKSEEIGW